MADAPTLIASAAANSILAVYKMDDRKTGTRIYFGTMQMHAIMSQEISDRERLYIKEAGAMDAKLELGHNGGVQRRANSKMKRDARTLTKRNSLIMHAQADKAQPTKTMSDNTATTDKPKRSKTNYDLVMGAILGFVTSNPGTTIPDIHEKFGVSDTNPTGHKAPVIYQAIRNLKKRGVVFGTGSKKSEALYLDAATAEANKPEPTSRPQRKKDKPFTLEKLMPKGNWWAIEGNEDRKAIEDAYALATTVPGSTFRVMDNTGDAPVMLNTNEQPATAKSKSKKDKPAEVIA